MGKKLSRTQRAARQRDALQRLLMARESSPEDLAIEALLGNQYARQVARGYLLEDGIPKFEMTSVEMRTYAALHLALQRVRDDDVRERDKRNLRSRQVGVHEYIERGRWATDLEACMDKLIQEAHAGGRITDEEFAYIEKAKKRRGRPKKTAKA